MLWTRRVVGVLLTCLALGTALFVVSAFVGSWSGLFMLIFGMYLFPAGLLAGFVVGLPGLAWIDHVKPPGPWPSRALAALVGIVALVAAAFAQMLFVSTGSPWLRSPLDVALLAGLLAVPGCMLGAVGGLVFRWIDDGLRQAFEAVAFANQLRKLPPEERRALGSRLDRDR